MYKGEYTLFHVYNDTILWFMNNDTIANNNYYIELTEVFS